MKLIKATTVLLCLFLCAAIPILIAGCNDPTADPTPPAGAVAEKVRTQWLIADKVTVQQGGLAVEGRAALDGGIGVDSNFTVDGTTGNVTTAGDLAANRITANGIDIGAGGRAASADLLVNGSIVITGNITTTGTLSGTFANLVDIAARSLALSGPATAETITTTGSISATGDIMAWGDLLIGGSLGLNGDIEIGTAATITLEALTGDVSTAGGISTGGDINVDGNLTVGSGIELCAYTAGITTTGQIYAGAGLRYRPATTVLDDDYTIDDLESGTTFLLTPGTYTVTLPAATQGIYLCLYNGGATVTLETGSAIIINQTTAPGHRLQNAVLGGYLCLLGITNDVWGATGIISTWNDLDL